VAVAKAALSLGVLATGFVALSDDDYSRTVIAEQFAQSPSLDPSGTSWLPLPFWLHGAAMSVFGRSLLTAHATAVALGVVSAVCIHRAALWLGLPRPLAFLSALVATAIPTAARLGVCTQPEALVAGLVMLGAASTTVDGSRRVAGAIALFAACLCRYEAWAAAAAFAAITAYDAARTQRTGRGAPPSRSTPSARARAQVACAAIAIAAPLLWIAHGVASHGDALFFLHRVAAYRRALGVTEPFVRSLLAYPSALLRFEPEVTLSAIGIAFALVATARSPRPFAVFSRPAVVVGGILAFLVVGRVLDGAPTHHAERTLLPVWTFLSLFVANGVTRVFLPASGRPLSAAGRAIPFAIGVALVSALLRAGIPDDPGAPRDAQRAIGELARARVTGQDRLLVDTSDYGYFAVIAAFGAPERAEPVDRHDPRRPSSSDPLATELEARSLLSRTSARWLVVEAPHLHLASSMGIVAANAGDLSLVRLSALR
jgi:hypothetical protein